MFGMRTWQLWCGNGWVNTHVSVHCMQLCADTCATAGNGICEDGGAHSVADTCYYGTDCADCDARGKYIRNHPWINQAPECSDIV